MVRLALAYSSGVSRNCSPSLKSCQPASLQRPVTGSGNIDSATGPNPAKRASVCFSSCVAGRCSSSMVFSVRMAAMMSRALPFSPLAMATAGAGPGGLERGVWVSGGLTALAGVAEVAGDRDGSSGG